MYKNVRERVREIYPNRTLAVIGHAQRTIFDIPLHIDRDGQPLLKLTELLPGLQATLSLMQAQDSLTGKYTDAKSFHGSMGAALVGRDRYFNTHNHQLWIRDDGTLPICTAYGGHVNVGKVIGTAANVPMIGSSSDRMSVYVQADTTNVSPIYVGYSMADQTENFELVPGAIMKFDHSSLNLYFYGAVGDIVRYTNIDV